MDVEKPGISLIASFTDFGPTGPYQGQMAAVLASRVPNTPRVSLMVDAPMFDPMAAGLLLSGLCRDIPLNTLILAVVDPGVGGDRQPLMLRTEQVVLVGPDNGLFIPIIRQSQACEIETISWRPHRLSQSFHGRDLFAPVAAKLANGEAVEGCVIRPEELVGFDVTLDESRIIYTDHYGNAITGIQADRVNDSAEITINGTTLRYARTFNEVPIGQAFWYRNSMGLVEFAVNCGNATSLLELNLGMPVVL